jgi:hypothetical protein
LPTFALWKCIKGRVEQMRLSSALLSSIAVVALACSSFAAQERRPPARASISDVAWLASGWISAAQKVTVEERWTPPAGGAMLAVSRTLKGDRMVAFEYLRIVERNGGLVYIAQPNGRPPTEFVMTALSSRAATFENPAHDFPKMIQYTLRPDGTLEARVSDGGQRAESFLFTRIR